jgi:D-sedoheptulose 7-phosphate isomerase
MMIDTGGLCQMRDYRDAIKAYIRLECDVLSRLDVDSINEAMNLLEDAFEKEKPIYIFGNGGSAATASHFQNDFNKGISEHTSKKFRFQCLNDNVATILAIANDIAFEEIFRFQLVGRLRQDDIVIAISGSGNSKNVLNAAEYAKETKAKVIGITGYGGGRLKGLSDVWLNAPINSMQVTEDVHMILDHLMMSIFYITLAGINHLGN